MDSKKMREYKYIRNTLPISNRAMTLDLSSTFSIDSDEYVFILGMTWEDWVNSSFNTIGLKSTNWGVTDNSGNGIYDNSTSSSVPVQSEDKIKKEGEYIVS